MTDTLGFRTLQFVRIAPFCIVRLILLCAAMCCISPLAASAAAPTLEHLYPVAVQLGSTNIITAIGKFDPWPPQVWVDSPGIMFDAETNSGKFTVTIAANAPVGPHLIRVFNEQGASGPRFLIITREPQAAEQEPNDDFSKPQLGGPPPGVTQRPTG